MTAANFAAAVDRHARLDRALRDGGPNPFPEVLEEGEWQYHLTAFRVDGPLDCELLQQAEAVIEELVEAYPELLDLLPPEEDGPDLQPAGPAPADPAVLPECLRIYRESLPELTEDELRADLETCLQAGRTDTAGLVEAELRRRERETAPELPPGIGVSVGRSETVGERCAVPHDRPPVGSLRKRPSSPTAAVLRLTRRRAVQHVAVPDGAPSAPAAGDPPSGSMPAERETPSAVSAYTTKPAWIDTAGRTRTWSLLDPSGAKVADITTKRGAEKLAALLTRVMGRPATPSP